MKHELNNLKSLISDDALFVAGEPSNRVNPLKIGKAMKDAPYTTMDALNGQTEKASPLVMMKTE